MIFNNKLPKIKAFIIQGCLDEQKTNTRKNIYQDQNNIRPQSYEFLFFYCVQLSRDENPDPVGSVDFWPAGSGSDTFFTGSDTFFTGSDTFVPGSGFGSFLSQSIYQIIFILEQNINQNQQIQAKMMGYKIEFYSYLPNI